MINDCSADRTSATPYSIIVAGDYLLSASSPSPLRHLARGLIEHDNHDPAQIRIIGPNGEAISVFEDAQPS